MTADVNPLSLGIEQEPQNTSNEPQTDSNGPKNCAHKHEQKADKNEARHIRMILLFRLTLGILMPQQETGTHAELQGRTRGKTP